MRQRKNGGPREGGAAHGIEQAEDRVGKGGVEVICKDCARIHIGKRDDAAQTVDQQDHHW